MPTRKPKRTNWRALYENAKANASFWGNQFEESHRGWIQAKNDLKAAIERAESAERHNAELLKEREARPPEIVLNCDRCNRPVLGKTVSYRCVECANQPDKPPSWLRRNWVELTVMAIVLGAIAFIVWRAWR